MIQSAQATSQIFQMYQGVWNASSKKERQSLAKAQSKMLVIESSEFPSLAKKKPVAIKIKSKKKKNADDGSIPGLAATQMENPGTMRYQHYANANASSKKDAVYNVQRPRVRCSL